MTNNKIDTDYIKDHIDIVELIGEYVELEKHGNGYRGLCPFHNDTSPSFNVSSQKKTWKCFVCDNGGDVIEFYQKKHDVSFLTAINELNKKYNLKIETPLFNRKSIIKPEHLVLDDISKFYISALNSTAEGHSAIDYLNGRGITSDTIKEFHLGYSYDEAENVHKYLTEKVNTDQKYSHLSISNLNQFNENNRDLFANRITVPIISDGNIIGFGGRTLAGNVKYLNSRDSIVFKKKNILFNFDNAIYYNNHNSIYVVEGYFDVIRAHQEGVKNVLGLMGTAFNKEHVNRLKKSQINTVYLGLDTDNAGKKATIDVGSLLVSQGLTVKVITYPNVKDIDEYFNSYTLSDFKNLSHNAKEFKIFELDYSLENMSSNSLEQQQHILDRVFLNISDQSELVIESIFTKLSANFNLSRDFLNEKLKNSVNSKPPVAIINDNELPFFEQTYEFQPLTVNIPEFMTIDAFLAKRLTTNRQRYLEINVLLEKYNVNLHEFSYFFEDLGRYYQTEIEFDVINFTNMFNTHDSVFKLFENCEIKQTEETDEQLVRLLKKDNWTKIL